MANYSVHSLNHQINSLKKSVVLILRNILLKFNPGSDACHILADLGVYIIKIIKFYCGILILINDQELREQIILLS